MPTINKQQVQSFITIIKPVSRTLESNWSSPFMQVNTKDGSLTINCEG